MINDNVLANNGSLKDWLISEGHEGKMLNLRQDGGQRGQEARSGANSAAIQKSKKLLR